MVDLCFFQRLKYERPAFVENETIAVEQDDVSASGRAGEPDDSLSYMDHMPAAILVEAHQFVTTEPDSEGS